MIRRRVTTVDPPSGEVIPLVDAKSYLRVEETADDTLITRLISAATASAEEFLRMSLRTRTLRLTTDRPGLVDADEALVRLGPGVFDVPRAYITGSTEQTLELPNGPPLTIVAVRTFNNQNVSAVYGTANYFLDAAGERLVLNQNATWPEGLRERAAIEVDYTVGNLHPNAAVTQGILEHVAAMYECRGGCDMPEGVRSILRPYMRQDLIGLA